MTILKNGTFLEKYFVQFFFPKAAYASHFGLKLILTYKPKHLVPTSEGYCRSGELMSSLMFL